MKMWIIILTLLLMPSPVMAKAKTKMCQFYPSPLQSAALYFVPLGTPCDRRSYAVYDVDQDRWPRPSIQFLEKQYKLLQEVDRLDCVLKTMTEAAERWQVLDHKKTICPRSP